MKNNIIIPIPGSVVRTYVDGIKEERIIKVKEIILNRNNSYLIRYDDEKRKERLINCGWVTEILENGTAIPKPINYFNELMDDRYLHYKRIYYCGSLSSIVRNCMRKLPYQITRPLDWKRVEKLFYKTKPGYVGNLSFGLDINSGYPIIKKKKIQKWVAVNWTKLLMSEKKWQKEIDVEEKEMADMYWEDIERGMEKDMDEEFWENAELY